MMDDTDVNYEPKTKLFKSNSSKSGLTLQSNSQHMSDMVSAIRKGDSKELCRLIDLSSPIKDSSSMIYKLDWKGWNLLHEAAACDQVACIKVLLQKAPDLAVETVSKLNKFWGQTPLYLACEMQRDIATIEALLWCSGQAAVNIFKPVKSPVKAHFPIQAALLGDKTENGDHCVNIIHMLKCHGAVCNNETLLKDAIYAKKLGVVRYLAFTNTKLEKRDESNKFPLFYASTVGYVPILKFLLGYSSRTINAKDKNGRTSLIEAASHGHLECVKLLVDANAHVTTRDKEEYSALSEAVANGHVEVVNYLLSLKKVQQSAPQAHRYKPECHPLLIAVCKGFVETLRALLQSGYRTHDLAIKNIKMCDPIQDDLCIDWRWLQLPALLLNRNPLPADIHEMLLLLMDHGIFYCGPIKIGFSPNSEGPPLTAAVDQALLDEEKSLLLVKTLLDYGANLEFRSSCGNVRAESCPDAFVVAMQLGSEPVLKMLLRYWPHPPCQLLVSYDKRDYITPIDFSQWFPFLSGFGIPPGADFLPELRKRVKEHKGEDKQMFLDKLNVPCSLLQQARFKIREQLKKAEEYEKFGNLPDRVKCWRIPKRIKRFLLMDTLECDKTN